MLAYEAILQKLASQFNSLYAAGATAEKSGNKQKVVLYFLKASAIADTTFPGSNSKKIPASLHPDVVMERYFVLNCLPMYAGD